MDERVIMVLTYPIRFLKATKFIIVILASKIPLTPRDSVQRTAQEPQ